MIKDAKERKLLDEIARDFYSIYTQMEKFTKVFN